MELMKTTDNVDLFVNHVKEFMIESIMQNVVKKRRNTILSKLGFNDLAALDHDINFTQHIQMGTYPIEIT